MSPESAAFLDSSMTQRNPVTLWCKAFALHSLNIETLIVWTKVNGACQFIITCYKHSKNKAAYRSASNVSNYCKQASISTT